MQEHLVNLDGQVAELKLFKLPNATIFGQPTIQDGQISNFTEQNYLQFPFLVDFAGRPWQIDCAFTTGEDVSQQHNIFDSAFGLAFAFANGHFVLAMSSNGFSWNLGANEGTHAILPSTTYYVRIAWDGTTYSLAFSTDRETYTTDISVASTETLYPKQIIIGKSILSQQAIFNGSINLNDAYLTISGKVVWQGMDDAGLATRLAVDMSNIDPEGIHRLYHLAAPSLGVATVEGNAIWINAAKLYYLGVLDGSTINLSLDNVEDGEVLTWHFYFVAGANPPAYGGGITITWASQETLTAEKLYEVDIQLIGNSYYGRIGSFE